MRTARCRSVIDLAVVSLIGVAVPACQRAPARLVVGAGDTVVVNHVRAVRLPAQALDASGHGLPDSGVRFQWVSGAPIPVSPRGVVRCRQAGDAILCASLGRLATSVLLRCRPVQQVRGGGLLSIVLGDPAPEVSFEPLGLDGRPVTLYAAHLTVTDTPVLTLDGWRIHPRDAGWGSVDIQIGDSSAYWSVHVYQRARSLEGIQPGQHLAVPVRVAAGEMQSWQLPASPKNYSVEMLPDRDTQHVPRLSIVGANCDMYGTGSFECLARRGAWLMVYHPRRVDAAHEWSGRLAVFRRDRP